MEKFLSSSRGLKRQIENQVVEPDGETISEDMSEELHHEPRAKNAKNCLSTEGNFEYLNVLENDEIAQPKSSSKTVPHHDLKGISIYKEFVPIGDKYQCKHCAGNLIQDILFLRMNSVLESFRGAEK